MIKPNLRKMEYEVGNDAYGRTVLLRFDAGCAGEQPGWEIHVLASNQRDDDQRLGMLTPEVILAMAEVINAGGAR